MFNKYTILYLFLALILMVGCSSKSNVEYEVDELQISFEISDVLYIEEFKPFFGASYDSLDPDVLKQDLAEYPYKKIEISWSVKDGYDASKYTKPPLLIITLGNESSIIGYDNKDLISYVGSISNQHIYDLLKVNNYLDYIEKYPYRAIQTKSFEQGRLNLLVYNATIQPDCYYVYFDQDDQSGFVVPLTAN